MVQVTWGLGGMGFWGTWGLGDMVQKTYTPLGLDMGIWGHGDTGGEGDTGFRVRHGDMGTQVGKGTWGLGLDMGTSITWGHGV